MCGFPLAISCCTKISNIPSKFDKYIDGHNIGFQTVKILFYIHEDDWHWFILHQENT